MSYILPTHFSPWKPTTVNQVKCPLYQQHGFVNRTISMGFLDSVEVIKMVDGDLIHKVAYETVCSEGFLGNKELDYVIHKPDFKEEDVSGPFMKPYFPEPRCSWESTKSHVKVFLFKELHPIRMDIYDGSYVSPLFPGGKCHHVGCLTIHSNVFWLPS